MRYVILVYSFEAEYLISGNISVIKVHATFSQIIYNWLIFSSLALDQILEHSGL